MAINDLPTSLVNVIIENYNTTAKSIIVLFIISLSIIYLVFKKNERETQHLTIGFLRILTTAYSFGTLIAIPLFIFVLNPYFDLYALLDIVFLFYIPFIIIGGLLIFAEILLHGSTIILKLSNFDIKDKRINAIYSKIFKKKKGWDSDE